MKGKEYKELTKEELIKKQKDLKEESFNLRFQHSTGQLENTSRIRLIRRDVARIETVLRDRDLKGTR
jgi:large subunit ribosomal protein L29